MKNEVLTKLVCHNLCCLIASQYELGIEATFWGEQPASQACVQHAPGAETVAEVPPAVKPETVVAPIRRMFCAGA